MINLFTASLLCLFSQVSLPAQAKVDPGRLLKLTAISEGKIIRWINPNNEVDLIVSDNGKWAIFSTTIPGQYKVFCYTATADLPSEPAMCIIKVGNDEVIPTPSNLAMLEALQIAFEKLSDKNKTESLALLIKAYQAVVLMLDSTDIDTTANFLLLARTASRKHISGEALLSLREIFAADLDLIVSTNPEDKFTSKMKTTVKERFKSYINLLGKI